MADDQEKFNPNARIGLFGGSFNPPHIGHVLVAAWALAGGELDELWVIPTGGHPFGKRLAPFEDRLELCWRAFECFGERVSLLDVEREPRVHYSIDTFKLISQRCPPTFTYRWIMGSDTLADAHQWKSFDELMSLAPPLLIPRDGHGDSATPGSKTDAAEPGGFSLPDISSTFIRERLAGGDYAGIKAYLPGAVLDYIRAKGLYLASAG